MRGIIGRLSYLTGLKSHYMTSQVRLDYGRLIGEKWDTSDIGGKGTEGTDGTKERKGYLVTKERVHKGQKGHSRDGIKGTRGTNGTQGAQETAGTCGIKRERRRTVTHLFLLTLVKHESHTLCDMDILLC